MGTVAMMVGPVSAMSALPEPALGANIVPGDPPGYASEALDATLARVKALGGNTVAFLLEASVESADNPVLHPPTEKNLTALSAGLRKARIADLATVLIPHVVMQDGSWRGHLDLEPGQAFERFFRDYRRFILLAARSAAEHKVALLSLGVEWKAMSSKPSFVDRMRGLAREVRQQYAGLLTYNANWDEAETVGFWDAVDLVGLQAYYPLTPTPELGAKSIALRMQALSHRAHRRIIILEVGYRASPHPTVEPWLWADAVASTVDQEAQARAYRAVLDVWLPLPELQGLLVWFAPSDLTRPNFEPRHGFSPFGKSAEKVIFEAFRGIPSPSVEKPASLRPIDARLGR
jgi:hypothetical protein